MAFTKNQKYLILLVTLASFVGTFLISSVNIALPKIENTFNYDAITLSWVITSYLLASAAFILPIGRWADLFGLFSTYKIGIVIFSVGSLGCAIVSSGYWFIFFRIIQGIGAAFSNATGVSIVTSMFLPNQRGKALGLSVSGVYMGLAIGPFIGGIIVQYFGWRYIFYLSTFIGIILTYMAISLLKNVSINKNKASFNYFDSIIYMTGLVGLVYGASKIPDIAGWFFLGIGVVFLIVFWILQNHSKSPIFDNRLFTQNRLFAYSNIAAFINYSVTYSLVFLLSLYLQKIKGLSPQQTGTILVVQPLIMAIFSPITGQLSDVMQPRYLATLGMILCSIGLFIFSNLQVNTSLLSIVIGLLIMGSGFALFSSPNMNTIMAAVNNTQLGVASASASTMRVMGQIFSMTIVVIIFSIIIGPQAINTVSTEIFLIVLHSCFYIFGIICIIGIYFSLHRGEILRQNN